MINNGLRPYEEYKVIDLPWLDTVPSHWNIRRNKNVMIQNKYLVGLNHYQYKLLSLTLKGVIARDMVNPKGKFPKEFDTYQVVGEKDLVFCLFDIDETPRTVGISPMDGMITGAYTVFKARNANEKFLYYYYLAMDNNKMMKPLYTGLRKVISSDTFLRTKLPIPPRQEQDQIVKYLDYQLAKINKFIKAKKKQIAALKEQKQVIINEAVIKGLDTQAKMKYSEIEWLGDVPEHWEITRIKWLFSEKDERKSDKDLELLTFSRKKGLILYSEYSEKPPSAKDLSEYKVVRPGDLLMNKMQAWSGMFTDVCTTGVVSPDYSVFKPTNIAHVGFYSLVFRTERHVQQFALASKGIGSGFNRLYTPSFGSIYTVLPPFDEQMAIVENINKKTLGINTSIYVIEKEIELISEYKGSLISDVVTGKVDVRNIIIEDIKEIEIDDQEFDEEPIEEEILDIEDGDE